jgi:hypothetical protein
LTSESVTVIWWWWWSICTTTYMASGWERRDK